MAFRRMDGFFWRSHLAKSHVLCLRPVKFFVSSLSLSLSLSLFFTAGLKTLCWCRWKGFELSWTIKRNFARRKTSSSILFCFFLSFSFFVTAAGAAVIAGFLLLLFLLAAVFYISALPYSWAVVSVDILQNSFLKNSCLVLQGWNAVIPVCRPTANAWATDSCTRTRSSILAIDCLFSWEIGHRNARPMEVGRELDLLVHVRKKTINMICSNQMLNKETEARAETEKINNKKIIACQSKASNFSVSPYSVLHAFN